MISSFPQRSSNRDVTNAVNDQAYQSILDFYRSSIRDEQLLDAASAMPSPLSRVLKEAAELTDKQPPEDDPGRGEALRLAVTQFAEQILFIDHANYYRILGLNRDADMVQIKEHYKWLSRLLFPVEDAAHWNEANAVLLNRAYSVLRDPKFRKTYNEECLNKSSIDKTLGVKREVAARSGGGQEAAVEAMASASEQAQFPAEGGFTTEQASANSSGRTAGSSFVETNIHRLNPTPFARVKADRFPADLMSAAAVKAGPPPTSIPVADDSAFPSPAKTVEAVHGSWFSLVAKIGFPIAVGVGVLVYLGDISLPFTDHRDANRQQPVTINPPAVVGTGQLIARSDPPVHDPAGDQNTAIKPVQDTVSDLDVSTLEPTTTISSGGTPGLAAVPDKQIAPVPPPLSGDKRVIAAAQTPSPSLSGDSSLTSRSKPAPPLHVATEQMHAKTTHTNQEIKPAVSSTPPSSPSSRSADLSRHPGPAAVPEKQIAPVPPPLSGDKRVIAAAEMTPSSLPGDTAITGQSHPASPGQAVTEQMPAKTAHTEEGLKPAAASALSPQPAESAGEHPPSRSTDISAHPGVAAVTDTVKQIAPVAPALSGDKLAKAAAQMLPPPLPADSSSIEESRPASPLQAATEHHLGNLVKTFISSYEAGDMDIFMSLLSDDAHTKSQKDRESIRTAYDQLFQATRNRRLKLHGLEWTRSDDGTLIGRAPFLLTLNQEGKKDPLRFAGTMIFRVQNRSSHLLITQFDYQYKAK